MSDLPTYEIYAIRYAEMANRRAHDNFIFPDDHDALMPIDYFVWIAVGGGRTFVIDTGFDAAMAKQRGRTLVRSPAEGLRAVGFDPATIEDVIITHLHYDHAGGLGFFPKARFHLQDREMMFATGRHMCHGVMRHAFEADHVVEMVRAVYAERVAFHDGQSTLAPGLSLHHIGGHTMGLQAVRLWTRRGWVVLASDASHFYGNIEKASPFPLVFNVGEMLEGYGTLRRLAASPAHIVPGHDPQVMARYPAVKGRDGIAVRLDLDPI